MSTLRCTRLGCGVGSLFGVPSQDRIGARNRDLKPSNVLVVEQDGRPVAKIIDFGIGRRPRSG